MSRKRRVKRKNTMDDSWLLPYADMLTLLLALFIVLFAMSEVDVKRFKKLAYIFETEFVGGAGVIEEGITIVPEDDSQSTTSTENETSTHDVVDEDDDT